MSQYDKAMKCPFCGETSLHQMERTADLKWKEDPLMELLSLYFIVPIVEPLSE